MGVAPAPTGGAVLSVSSVVMAGRDNGLSWWNKTRHRTKADLMVAAL